jgi:hypothetical protein
MRVYVTNRLQETHPFPSGSAGVSYLCSMALQYCDSMILSRKAFEMTVDRYPAGLSIRHVEVVRAVQVAGKAVGSCLLMDIRRCLLAWERSNRDSYLLERLAYLCSVGLLKRELKGLRMRYSVTVLGVNLLYDMERALRRLKI